MKAPGRKELGKFGVAPSSHPMPANSVPTAQPGSGVTLSSAALEYLCIDAFLRTLADAGALKTAFELRLIDLLLQHGPTPFDALATHTGSDPQGLRFLLDLLCANRVVETRDGAASLHPAFGKALRFRDLLETKLEYAGFMLADFSNLFTAMIANPQRFMRYAQVFRLFDYGRCFEATAENHRHAQGWMRLTSALTRYEAPVCIELHDFSHHRRMLDVGGNSGEFLVQACRRHSGLSGTVLDLPVVCNVGLEHVLEQPECPRISFLKADIRHEPLPAGYDLITFKSMLHDWPLDEAGQFLEKAAKVLEPGGTIMIFERGPLEVREEAPAFSSLPLLMFFRSYRSPAAYLQKLRALGFVDLRCLSLRLDTPFYLVTARRPAR